MGIVKISDDLHDEIRKSGLLMSRSINSQAEFWMKMGRLAELNPTLIFHESPNDQRHFHVILKLLRHEASYLNSLLVNALSCIVHS
ncbi:ParD-like family protein [Marinomonas sp.]